ncbi:MAG: hypothetical protein HKN09_06125 [Saprospiraceae bacterium]|nr:hypothetical protein [Saprospiraceae bacterium]
MFKNLLKINALVAILLVGLMTSCSKEEDNGTLVDNYVIESTYELQKKFRIGKAGCFELVFPVSVEFPDASTAEVDSYQNLKETVKAWKESNLDVEGRPSLVYPVEILDQEGEVISIDGPDALKEVIKECIQEFRDGPRDHHRRGKFRACFDLVFPLTINFPDSTTLEVEDYKSIKMAVRTWKHNNPDSAERPKLDFPIQIVYEDGTVEDIESVEDLKAAKRACRD